MGVGRSASAEEIDSEGSSNTTGRTFALLRTTSAPDTVPPASDESGAGDDCSIWTTVEAGAEIASNSVGGLVAGILSVCLLGGTTSTETGSSGLNICARESESDSAWPVSVAGAVIDLGNPVVFLARLGSDDGRRSPRMSLRERRISNATDSRPTTQKTSKETVANTLPSPILSWDKGPTLFYNIRLAYPALVLEAARLLYAQARAAYILSYADERLGLWKVDSTAPLSFPCAHNLQVERASSRDILLCHKRSRQDQSGAAPGSPPAVEGPKRPAIAMPRPVVFHNFGKRRVSKEPEELFVLRRDPIAIAALTSWTRSPAC